VAGEGVTIGGFRAGAALSGAVLLGGACSPMIDPAEARLCRLTLPALNDAGSRLVVDRTAPGPFRDSIRIDYRAIREAELTQVRFVVCRFGPERDGRGMRALTGLATEFGPMADASLHLMRRFYLDRTDPPPVDPAPQG
jgi:branched-chain amino acid transport system permease protein